MKNLKILDNKNVNKNSAHFSDQEDDVLSNKSGSNLSVDSGNSCDSYKTVLSDQSMMSILTIRSRASTQAYNKHWIERAAERGDLNLQN